MGKKQNPKKGKEPAISLTPEELSELEIILDRLLVQNPEGESFRSYLKSLRKALVGQENLLAGLLDRLAKNPSRTGFETFLVLQDAAVGKEYARFAKKIAYRFAQKGFVPTADAPAEERVVLIPKEERKPLAHVTPPGDVQWLLSVLIPEYGKSWPTAVVVFTEDLFHQVEVKVSQSSNRYYRDFIRKMSGQNHERKPFEIPAWHAAGLLDDVTRFFPKAATYPEVGRVKNLLQPFLQPERPPYIYELMPEIKDAEDQVRDIDIAGILPDMGTAWILLPREDLMSLKTEIDNLESGILVISDDIKRERSADLVKKAADTLVTGDRRLLYQRFFEEHALWLKIQGREDDAMSAWVVAQHLKGTGAASDNPAVFQAVVISMLHYWPQKAEEKPREKTPHVTESGLILPP